MGDFRTTPPFDGNPAPTTPVVHKKKPVLHSKEGFHPAHSDAKSDINITPLIDVMLVLLIIFMVVTPLAQKGLDIALPQPSPNQANKPDTPSTQVVLSLEDGGMSVNKIPVSTLEELDTKLKDIFQTKSDKTIFVRASGKTPYGKVVEAMDIARGAGVERIGIISTKMEEGAAAPAAPAQP